MRRILTKGIAAGALLIGFSGSLSAGTASVRPVPVDRSKLLVGVYCLAPYARTEAHVRDVRDCNVDFIYGIPAQDRATLDLCAKYGLGVIATGAVPFWHGMGGEQAGKMRALRPRADYERAMADFRDHPAIWMLDYVDEASALDYPYIGEIGRLIESMAPAGVKGYVNLYPNYASVSGNSARQSCNQLGTPTYAEHVRRYVENLPHDYLCFDFYLYWAKPEKRQEMLRRFHSNFADLAEAARTTGKSLWYIPQVNSVRPEQWISESQLRFQAFLALAYGTEVLQWACWSRVNERETPDMPGLHGWWTNNVLTLTGERTEQYDKLKKVNAELRRLGPVYMRYRNVATYHDDRFLGVRATDGSDVTVGEMVPRDGSDDRFAWLVFASDDPFDEHPAEHAYRFRPQGPVTVTGKDGPLELTPAADGYVTFRLRSSECAIVEMRKARMRLDRSKLVLAAWRFDESIQDEPHIGDLSACHITHVGCGLKRTAAPIFGKYGVGICQRNVVPFWSAGHGRIPGTLHEVNTLEQYDAGMAKYVDDPCVSAIYVVDEPSALDIPYLGKVIDRLVPQMPKGVFPYFNLYPNYALASGKGRDALRSQLGVPSYEDYLDCYCRHVNLDYLSLDNYCWGWRNTPGVLLENLRTASEVCDRTGRSLWIALQANSYWEPRPGRTEPPRPEWITENNLRFQAHASLAYGAEYLEWTCWYKGWWTNNVLDSVGRKTVVYDRLKRVNGELLKIGDAYMRHRHVKTDLVGAFDPDEARKVKAPVLDSSSGMAFSSVRATDGSALLVGHFAGRRADGERALYLVSCDDMNDIRSAGHQVVFRAVGSDVKAWTEDGVQPLAPRADGTCAVSILSNHGVLVTCH